MLKGCKSGHGCSRHKIPGEDGLKKRRDRRIEAKESRKMGVMLLTDSLIHDDDGAWAIG